MSRLRQQIKHSLDAALGAVTPEQPPRVLERLPLPYISGSRMRKILGRDLGAETVWKRSAVEVPDGELQRIFEETPNIHKWVHYLPVYEAVFAELGKRPLKMLEIGVARGGSLEMWRRFLHPETVITGLDIDPAAKRFDDPDRLIHVRIGDQQDIEFLRRVTEEFGPFDVILDDGGHTNAQMVNSFKYLFPNALASGGIYIVEDVHCNYQLRRGSSMSFVEFTKWLTDAMHAHYISTDETNYREGGDQRLNEIAVPLATTLLEKIEIHDSIIVIHRAKGQRDFPCSVYQ